MPWIGCLCLLDLGIVIVASRWDMDEAIEAFPFALAEIVACVSVGSFSESDPKESVEAACRAFVYGPLRKAFDCFGVDLDALLLGDGLPDSGRWRSDAERWTRRK